LKLLGVIQDAISGLGRRARILARMMMVAVMMPVMAAMMVMLSMMPMVLGGRSQGGAGCFCRFRGRFTRCHQGCCEKWGNQQGDQGKDQDKFFHRIVGDGAVVNSLGHFSNHFSKGINAISQLIAGRTQIFQTK
jgi:hypothetical protein